MKHFDLFLAINKIVNSNEYQYPFGRTEVNLFSFAGIKILMEMPFMERPTTLEGLVVPLLCIKKDIVDTFKVYKSSYNLYRDLYLTPLSGVVSCLRGVFLLLISLLTPLLILAIPFYGESSPKVSSILGLALCGVMSSLIYIFRGISQVAAWPLTFLRTPLRVLITKCSNTQYIEDNSGLRKLVMMPYESFDEDKVRILAHSILEKYSKAFKRGQPTTISRDTVPGLAAPGDVVRFFRAAIQARDGADNDLSARFTR